MDIWCCAFNIQGNFLFFIFSSFPGCTCFNCRSSLFSCGILKNAEWRGPEMENLAFYLLWNSMTKLPKRNIFFKTHMLIQGSLLAVYRLWSSRPNNDQCTAPSLISYHFTPDPGPRWLHTEPFHNPAHSDYYLLTVLPAFSSTLCFCPLLSSLISSLPPLCLCSPVEGNSQWERV